MDWQPIETAPMDGTNMLLAYRTLGVVLGHFDRDGTGDWWVAISRPDRPSIWSQWYLDSPDGEDPTHWMPLPEPPQTELTGDE
jgi:hypothetical protein